MKEMLARELAPIELCVWPRATSVSAQSHLARLRVPPTIRRRVNSTPPPARPPSVHSNVDLTQHAP